MRTINKIALEEHFLTPAMEEYWAPTVVHIDPAIYGRLHARLVDFGDSRIEAMDRAGSSGPYSASPAPACKGNPIRQSRAAGQAKPTIRWPATSRNGRPVTQDSPIWRCRTPSPRAVNIAFLLSRYFGMRSFGEIYGYFFSIFMVAAGLGPFAMGVSYDRTGSYKMMLLCFMLALPLACLPVLRLGAYAYPSTRQARRESVLTSAHC